MLPSMWSKYSFISDQSPAMPLTCVCARWMCESTKPGTTIWSAASMTSAFSVESPCPTSTISPSSISTSASSRSPISGSSVTTVPF